MNFSALRCKNFDPNFCTQVQQVLIVIKWAVAMKMENLTISQWHQWDFQPNHSSQHSPLL